MADEDKIKDEAKKDVTPEAEKDVEVAAEPEAKKDVEPEVEVEPAAAAETEVEVEAEKDVKPEPAPAPEVATEPEAEVEPESASDADDAPAHRTLPVPAWVALCVVALVVGVLGGYFLLGGASGGSISLDGRTTLSAGELDSAVAAYTYDGQRTSITAREVLTNGGATLDSLANDDGTYNVPAASDVLMYAQNKIILADAEKRGITASDEEVSDYAEQMMGSADLATIAELYGIDEDTVYDTFAESVTVTKLRNAVCETELPAQPTEPTEPEEGAEETPTADYASYIIALLGDEWDSEAGTWARTDGDYYATLSGYEITNDAATYAAAEAAYSVAYSAYSDASTKVGEEWTSYTKGLLSHASLQIGSLAES